MQLLEHRLLQLLVYALILKVKFYGPEHKLSPGWMDSFSAEVMALRMVVGEAHARRLKQVMFKNDSLLSISGMYVI